MKLVFNNNQQNYNEMKLSDNKTILKNDLDHFWGACYKKPCSDVQISVAQLRYFVSVSYCLFMMNVLI